MHGAILLCIFYQIKTNTRFYLWFAAKLSNKRWCTDADKRFLCSTLNLDPNPGDYLIFCPIKSLI